MPTAMDLLLSGGCDDILTVDLESRRIIIPNTVENLGVESDDSVRVLHFQVPRQYCEVDLATFDMRVNYKNTSGAGGSYDISSYAVEDGMIKFDWVVARHATVKRGDVKFNVCFREMVGEEVKREFNTTTATLPVLEGLETGDELMSEHIDAFEQMYEDAMSNVENTAVVAVEREVVNAANTLSGYVDAAEQAKSDAEKAKDDANRFANNAVNTISGYVDAAEQANADAQTAKAAAEQAATIVASVVIPPATSENNGMFLRAVDGVWAAVALTDVSEVGA